MSQVDVTYFDLLDNILKYGKEYSDPNRKGVKRLQIPSYTFKHSFDDGFPILTTKKVYWKGVVTELLWFLTGDTSTKFLIENGVNIWNKDGLGYINRGDEEGLDLKGYVENVKNGTLDGDLGRVYGVQWRDFRGIGDCSCDQIKRLITNMINNPMATNHLVNTWNGAELDQAALPPCHYGFQILPEPLGLEERQYYKTDCKYGFTLKWNQRSVDTFLGLPFNIGSYALLALILGKLTRMHPLGVEGNLSNVHIYDNHLSSVKEQLERPFTTFDSPKVFDFIGFEEGMNQDIDLWLKSIKVSDFKLENYKSYPAIKAEMLPYNK